MKTNKAISNNNNMSIKKVKTAKTAATRKKVNTVGFNFKKKVKKSSSSMPLVGRLYFGVLGILFLTAACSKNKKA